MKDGSLYPVTETMTRHLMDWFNQHQRSMPWRGEKEPYKVWISEIMLNQTQVTTVIPYYNRWLSRFPNVQTLAAATEDEVLKLWEGLGYYSRARHLHQAAQQIMTKRNGMLPNSYQEWLTLPGVGPYAAAAMASIISGEAVGVVDGNTKRVLSRLYEIDEDSSRSSFHTKIKAIIEETYFNENPGWVNQAWMELGALVCQTRPHCHNCPLQDVCQAYSHNTMTDYPVKPGKKALPLLKGAIFIFHEDDKILLVKRQDKGLLGGLWELPNTIYEEQPLADFTLANDILIEQSFIETASHQYSHFKVRFEIYESILRTPWWNDFWQKSEWVTLSRLNDYPRPKVHIKAMKIAGLI